MRRSPAVSYFSKLSGYFSVALFLPYLIGCGKAPMDPTPPPSVPEVMPSRSPEPTPIPTPQVDTESKSYKDGLKVGRKWGNEQDIYENERNKVNFFAQAAVKDHKPSDPISFAAGFRIGFWQAHNRRNVRSLQ